MKNNLNRDKEFYKWSKQKEFITSANYMEQETQEKLESAINFLQGELGKSFLKHFHAITQ